MPRKPNIRPALDRLCDVVQPHRGGHLTSPHPSFVVTANPVKIERAVWQLMGGKEIPPTHYLHRTCDYPGCIAHEHHELRPLKQPAEAAPRVQQAWAENRLLKARIAVLEAENADLKARLANGATALV